MMIPSKYRGPHAPRRQSRTSAYATAGGNTSARTPRTWTTWSTSLPVRESPGPPALEAYAAVSQLAHVRLDPVKYETLIRRFQTRAEKDAEAQRKGYSRVLEGDLVRSEAKLAALKATLPVENGAGEEGSAASRQGDGEHLAGAGADYDNGTEPATKEEGRELWNELLTDRFVRGEDPDFDYSGVDDDDGLDAMERQDAQDAWFDDEEPAWASGNENAAEVLSGETGVQDF